MEGAFESPAYDYVCILLMNAGMPKRGGEVIQTFSQKHQNWQREIFSVGLGPVWVLISKEAPLHRWP